VAYTGTHDNDTLKGWLNGLGEQEAHRVKEYLRLSKETPCWDAICALWASTAQLTVVQGQDLLELGSESRMNTPGTMGNNWVWRAKGNSFTNILAQKIKDKMELYDRFSDQKRTPC
jgi:4-alpha-glucanotransferase